MISSPPSRVRLSIVGQLTAGKPELLSEESDEPVFQKPEDLTSLSGQLYGLYHHYDSKELNNNEIRSEEREARKEQVLDAIRGYNRTSCAIEKLTGLHRATLMVYLRELRNAGALHSWRVGNYTWWTVTKAYLTRTLKGKEIKSRQSHRRVTRAR